MTLWRRGGEGQFSGVVDTPDGFNPFVEYCRLRLADDPHLWAVTPHDEVRELGYPGGYSTFTRALRTLRLRPHCEPCAASKGLRPRDHRSSGG